MKYLAAAAAGLAVLIAAVPALADSTKGKIVAYDRLAQRLVMNDKTIFSLSREGTEVPNGLTAGDLVSIEFESPGEDGISKILSITIINDEE